MALRMRRLRPGSFSRGQLSLLLDNYSRDVYELTRPRVGHALAYIWVLPYIVTFKRASVLIVDNDVREGVLVAHLL